jgi:hypothetical protein
LGGHICHSRCRVNKAVLPMAVDAHGVGETAVRAVAGPVVIVAAVALAELQQRRCVRGFCRVHRDQARRRDTAGNSQFRRPDAHSSPKRPCKQGMAFQRLGSTRAISLTRPAFDIVAPGEVSRRAGTKTSASFRIRLFSVHYKLGVIMRRSLWWCGGAWPHRQNRNQQSSSPMSRAQELRRKRG